MTTFLLVLTIFISIIVTTISLIGGFQSKKYSYYANTPRYYWTQATVGLLVTILLITFL